MSEPAKQTLDWHPPTTALGDHTADPRILRLRWRLITRPARPTAEALSLRINQIATPPREPILLSRWRPLSAPSNPRPAWRWPGNARAERASQRAAVGERWRPLTAR